MSYEPTYRLPMFDLRVESVEVVSRREDGRPLTARLTISGDCGRLERPSFAADVGDSLPSLALDDLVVGMSGGQIFVKVPFRDALSFSEDVKKMHRDWSKALGRWTVVIDPDRPAEDWALSRVEIKWLDFDEDEILFRLSTESGQEIWGTVTGERPEWRIDWLRVTWDDSDGRIGARFSSIGRLGYRPLVGNFWLIRRHEALLVRRFDNA